MFALVQLLLNVINLHRQVLVVDMLPCATDPQGTKLISSHNVSGNE
jgi:hypothetical protein